MYIISDSPINMIDGWTELEGCIVCDDWIKVIDVVQSNWDINVDDLYVYNCDKGVNHRISVSYKLVALRKEKGNA